MQVSRSKKWASKPLLDDAGKPVLQKNGKPVLKKSYSVLQDDFFNYIPFEQKEEVKQIRLPG